MSINVKIYKNGGELMNLKEIGRKIKEQRKYKGLTQAQLAEKANIAVGYLSGIERGEKIASLKVMLAIANKLNLSLDFMLLDDIENIDEAARIDSNLKEFNFMLKRLEDEELITEFISYCDAISKEMANKKKIKKINLDINKLSKHLDNQ